MTHGKARLIAGLLLAAVVLWLAPRVSAQDAIHILVLNGKTGKPITSECLDIFLPHRVWALVVPTDRRGVATIPLLGSSSGDSLAARPVRACNGAATPEPAIPPGGAFRVSGDFYVACQEYSFPRPPKQLGPRQAFPNYSVQQILRTGVVASNTCGKIRVQPVPGELIFFERPMTLWEKLRL